MPCPTVLLVELLVFEKWANRGLAGNSKLAVLQPVTQSGLTGRLRSLGEPEPV